MTHRSSIGISITEEQLLSDYSVSTWLKNQLILTKERDALEMLQETQLLISILEQRCIAAGIIAKQ